MRSCRDGAYFQGCCWRWSGRRQGDCVGWLLDIIIAEAGQCFQDGILRRDRVRWGVGLCWIDGEQGSFDLLCLDWRIGGVE